jgi:hypothetical protein
MSAHKLRVLLVVAVVAVVLALWASSVQQPQRSEQAGALLLPGLMAQLESATAFSVSGGDGGEIDIERDGEVWRLRQRHGYPADVGKLREYLLKLAEARLVEPKTANPANFPQLGVQDPSEEGADGTLVRIVTAAGERRLIVGRYNGQGSGTFVRHPDDPQSWLANADLTLDRDAARWLEREIVDLPSAQVRSLELVRADGEVIRAGKADEADTVFRVEDIPQGRELTSEFAASGLAGFLASLRLDDVRPAAEVEVPADVNRLTYETFDGRRYRMLLWDDEGRYLLTLSAEMLEAPEIAQPADESGGQAEAAEGEGVPEAGAEPDAGAALAERRARAAEEVERLNARAAGWVYQIPGFKWSAVNRRMEDLLKPAGD